MFANAYRIAIRFTRPVIISRQPLVGDPTSAIAGFVVINPDGWIVTAAHVIDFLQKLSDSKALGVQYLEQESEIRTDRSLTRKERRKRIRKLGKPNGLTQAWHASWGGSNVNVHEPVGIPKIDLAIARLEPFDPAWIDEYPVFKDANKPLAPGTSLCRIGYPFHTIEPTYDEDADCFDLPAGALPVPVFPIDGIYTRDVSLSEDERDFPLRFLETSSPGLRGQSGGPIVDTNGTVWAIQSQTRHFPLGFEPEAKGRTGRKVEHQFLNVGWGVHPATLTGFFDELGIAHQKSDY